MGLDPARGGRQPKYGSAALWPSMANKLRQITHPGRKIFLIGPNRCATTTFHNFFYSQGLKSIHWRKGEVILAKEIDKRLGDDRALRKFLAGWTVFSDFVYLTDEVFIENHTLYETYQRLFPEAYFILNDRDVDRWVASRLLHRDGGFLKRYLNVHGGTEDEAKAAWKTGFLAHREAVLKHFKDHPRFLHFHIDKGDRSAFIEPGDVDSLVALLAPDYQLSAEFWTSRNTDRRPKVDAPAAAEA